MFEKPILNDYQRKVWYVKDYLNEDGTLDYYTNPVKAIHFKCLLDCCAGDRDSMINCTCQTCFLYPFRLGKNPFRTQKVLSEEELERKRERLKAARNAKFGI